MVLTGTHMTADEFLLLPPSDRHYQLIDGEIVMHEPRPRHQRVQAFLMYRLMAWCEGDVRRGEVMLPLDVRLDDRNVFAPDLLWFPPETRPARDDPRAMTLPGIACEVRSPSTWRYDVGPKRERYEALGLPELWLVDTELDQVRILRRSGHGEPTFDVDITVGAGDQLESPQLPGFSLSVSDIFDR